LKNVNVNIFYPNGLISSIQEKQITCHGKNVKAYSVDGDFDECQDMVKQLLRDKIILSESFIFPANSINIIRLIPQVSYYFWAYIQLKTNKPVNFCVPSGNLGNITAGVIAYLMGLPVMDHLKKISIVIHLDVSLINLRKRLNNLAERGVVLKENQTFEDLFNERNLLYNKYSQIKFNNNSPLNMDLLSNITNMYINYGHLF
jgi:hypothetical protein